jgi:hypothetical protein
MFKGIPWAKPNPLRRRPFLGITDVENFSGIVEGHTKLHGETIRNFDTTQGAEAHLVILNKYQF